MIRLKVNDLLIGRGHSRYWLVKKMDSNYKTINRLADDVISSIKFETIEKLMGIFKLESLDDLIEYKKD